MYYKRQDDKALIHYLTIIPLVFSIYYAIIRFLFYLIDIDNTLYASALSIFRVLLFFSSYFVLRLGVILTLELIKKLNAENSTKLIIIEVQNNYRILTYLLSGIALGLLFKNNFWFFILTLIILTVASLLILNFWKSIDYLFSNFFPSLSNIYFALLYLLIGILIFNHVEIVLDKNNYSFGADEVYVKLIPKGIIPPTITMVNYHDLVLYNKTDTNFPGSPRYVIIPREKLKPESYNSYILVIYSYSPINMSVGAFSLSDYLVGADSKFIPVFNYHKESEEIKLNISVDTKKDLLNVSINKNEVNLTEKILTRIIVSNPSLQLPPS